MGSYKKLVRDKIPEIIKSNGEEPIIKILENDEYKKALETKLLEECNEVISAEAENRLEELADLLEVMEALAKLENADLNKINLLADKKRQKRGSFDKKIYLEGVK